MRLKRRFCLILCLLAALAVLPASALPRLPAHAGAVTDAADVLSAQTAADFSAYASEVEAETGLRLHVALVHFWDGLDAQAYADAWLGGTRVGEASHPVFNADCVTLNGYMGSDTIEPFVEACKAGDKCLFLLVKTSNPGSGELQDLKLADGRTIYEAMGELNESIAAGTQGKYGFTMAGAVTGATYPEQIQELRARLPHTFFLVPGYGAQGGTAADVKHAFNEKGHGAIVNSSRGIMCAWKKTGNNGLDFAQAARDAAIAMKEDIGQFVTIQ